MWAIWAAALAPYGQEIDPPGIPEVLTKED